MPNFITFLVVLLSIANSAKVVAEETSSIPPVGTFDCSAEKRLVNRGWMSYVAKNAISENELIAVGARLQALASVMAVCPEKGDDGKAKVNVDPLSKEEQQTFLQFEPSGPMNSLAKCLVNSAPSEADKFLKEADQLAFMDYRAKKTLGAFPDRAFVKMMEASSGCGDLLDGPVKSAMLYEDINWYQRIEPMKADIIAWHKQAEAQN